MDPSRLAEAVKGGPEATLSPGDGWKHREHGTG